MPLSVTSRLLRAVLLCAAVVLTGAQSAFAGVVVSVTSLPFGVYSSGRSTALPAESVITVTADSGLPFWIAIDNGLHYFSPWRRLAAGESFAVYQLYRDANHTLTWGAAVGPDTVSGTGSGSPQSFTVYGLLPANQTPPDGDYADTIRVTVEF